ncbi:MAG: hypothetical protein COV74_10650 [Candidatus Omnitrophica bacterium CG11_big_fil_rev_8_21_14_0_20_45_26]|uniref:Uncharacterized protein n=1 Tax=Candidatus Abzuiibacterium crystallinum TaxID=1974748 RepID=A0A2H0LKU9_9BACT|nr:MAG: hypothetical protein COV74_10650 [Candidatus Omnitrophica bacterium CG11_big_fil_rev_8_21_14_0_20_45_26]PIW63875.1 MAG: hypothetical protein COW12_08160 [Candidatus Omnitrophica bacterium CG12_big_fil_rev_8_21_14_0_65_45_16]
MNQEESLKRQQIELARAKKVFTKLLKEEKNEVRFQKMRPYERLVEQALTAEEVRLLQKQAISDADKEYAVLRLQQAEIKKDAIRRKLEVIIWMIGVLACAVIYSTGFEEIFYYQMKDGAYVQSQQYEGKELIVGETGAPVIYSHKERKFRSDDIVRIAAMVIIIGFCIMNSVLAEKDN